MKYFPLITFLVLLYSQPVSAMKVGQHMASIEALLIFTDYLYKQGIPYKVNDSEPDIVWWSPNNEQHMNQMLQEAFGVPKNQRQLIVASKDEQNRITKILDELGIKFTADKADGNYIVLWYPDSEALEKRFNEQYH